MSEKQFYLLQVNDALFPIGGYSHSQGLETYIQRGIVHNVDTAREYITHKIKWNLAYTELLAASLCSIGILDASRSSSRYRSSCRSFSLQLRMQVWLPEVLYTQDSI